MVVRRRDRAEGSKRAHQCADRGLGGGRVARRGHTASATPLLFHWQSMRCARNWVTSAQRAIPRIRATAAGFTNVVLNVDTGTGAAPQADQVGCIYHEVDVLIAHLKRAECRKFALTISIRSPISGGPRGAQHKYCCTLCEDRRQTNQRHTRDSRALEKVGLGESLLFGRILRDEYYVQALALAIQRLCVLSRNRCGLLWHRRTNGTGVWTGLKILTSCLASFRGVSSCWAAG